MSHTKAGGSTRNGRDSKAKRLGVKRYGGQLVQPGDVLIRQRGSKYAAGAGVEFGRDYTIFATQAGKVEFSHTRKTRFTGKTQAKTIVSVSPVAQTSPSS